MLSKDEMVEKVMQECGVTKDTADAAVKACEFVASLGGAFNEMLDAVIKALNYLG